MGNSLTPTKIALLAAHLAVYADVNGLRWLISEHSATFSKALLLRILLTYLPETLQPGAYLLLLKDISVNDIAKCHRSEPDISWINALSDHQALRRARKLRLARLRCLNTAQDQFDLLSTFLVQKAFRIDSEAGVLSYVPDFLVPLLHHSPALSTRIVATVLPFARRNVQYYLEIAPAHSLVQFQSLAGPDAVDYLLSRSGGPKFAQSSVVRDLRGLIGPWLCDSARWESAAGDQMAPVGESRSSFCSGWEQTLSWLTTQAKLSWDETVGVIEHWDGPADIDLGPGIKPQLSDEKQRYLDHTYASALLGMAYCMQDATLESLSGAYRVCAKARLLLGHGQGDLSLRDVLLQESLPDMSTVDTTVGAKAIGLIRRFSQQSWNNCSVAVDQSITDLLMALITSALVLSRLGMPYTVRKVGDLAFAQDDLEQKAEVAKLLHAISSSAHQDHDEHWIKCRRDILWLRDWGRTTNPATATTATAVLGAVSKEFLESELLKALLSRSRYNLARALFEERAETILAPTRIRELVLQAALHAFDNASELDRTRGGLKRCGDIIRAFPVTVGDSSPGPQRIWALLRAIHILSRYQVVVQPGEPFSPVVLRAHPDPIEIINKILQQNPKAYTRLQEFLEMGIDIIQAGLLPHTRADQVHLGSDTHLYIAGQRITAMCVEAALKEDDFETAYSYVVSRLGLHSLQDPRSCYDKWSWAAASRAGQHVLDARSEQPTHLSNAGGDIEIRHLEQRLECLATSLRLAPTSQVHDILKAFRRCEEQFDSAVMGEMIKEAAWDATHKATVCATARQAEEYHCSLQFAKIRFSGRASQFRAYPAGTEDQEKRPT
ncbi:hypothetical protein CDD83_2303 [Cordyceps sp. RAO-2017]|nr:hypothetical protein CDD83_2303 [Cordyceps sp. RAO-2017]